MNKALYILYRNVMLVPCAIAQTPGPWLSGILETLFDTREEAGKG